MRCLYTFTNPETQKKFGALQRLKVLKSFLQFVTTNNLVVRQNGYMDVKFFSPTKKLET